MIPRGVKTSKDNQVPLGHPPAGRHLNTGESQNRGKGIIADTHEARGQDSGLGLKSCVEQMTDETQHEAGLQRGKSRLRWLGRGLGLCLAST